MSPSRDGLFPSASIGRSGSPQLQRIASHESLNAHPLLSPSSPSPSASNHGHAPDASASAAPRYVPYTPRHRPPTSSATTGMTTQPSMPVAASHQHLQGGATSKLQQQNLKAAAQGIGLGSGTVGWAILEKLVDGETGVEWDEIWSAISTAKPTLLLPLEPYSGEVITPELVRDHIAFCNATSPSPLVTLSGLRGVIHDGCLTLQSTLPLTSQPFADLMKADIQSTVLMSLPPLPASIIPDAASPFPSFALPGSTSLPLPPRFHITKPPLPPRPGTTPPKPISTTRISNPFASLFARQPSTSITGNPTVSPSPSQISLPSDDTHSVANTGVEVAAFSVGTKIIKKQIGKDLSRMIKDEIKTGLAECPSWVIDRVIDFTGPLYPLPKTSKRIDIRRTTSGSSRSSNTVRQAPLIISLSSDPSALSEAFQSFYAVIEEDLRAGPLGSTLLGRRRDDKKTTPLSQDNSNNEPANSEKVKDFSEGERREQDESDSEGRIKEILERIERVICSVFYDRAFRPLSGDDASHDGALANRIAALNMLDLGLEHLGVDIPNDTIKSDVNKVVEVCGATLQRLEDSNHRSPGQKSALLVEAHKQIVDGLSRLPQLRLKPEREFVEERDQKTPRASTFGKQAAQEAIYDSKTLASSQPDPASMAQDITPGGAKESEEATMQSETTSETSIVSSPDEMNAPSTLPTSDTTETITNMPHDAVVTLDAVSPPAEVAVPLKQTSSPPSTSTSEVSKFPTPKPATVSGDILFPLLIFSVVKSNPANLVSHLLYTQRFRSRSVGGQESYCLINLMAVVEFLEHVDMSALGLGDSERVMSTADLTPIPLAHGSIDSSVTSSSPFSTRLGQRVNQQVEELAGLAGSANKVITGVVDSSFGVIRGFLAPSADLLTPHGELQDSAPWNAIRPGFGLLRRGSTFSIANVAASLPGAGRPKTPVAGEEGQQLIEVSSRPGSIKEVNLDEDEDEEEEETSASSVVSDEESQDEGVPDRNDGRSIRSFSSMMSRESRDRDRDRDRADGKERMSLTDRLASMSGRSKGPSSSGDQLAVAKASPPPSRTTSRPSSWLPPPTTLPDLSEVVTTHVAPKIRIPPPNRRFLECAEQDIRVGEVGMLLREYRRMVQALRQVGAFEDHV
ncbi:hypothetical protein K439DRAFT_1653309 [Ramaria rubella]|nr:hypothetical protein K439DRAFT_1653309 [Ramaria rubella]